MICEPWRRSYDLFMNKYNSVQDKIEYYRDQWRMAEEDYRAALNDLSKLGLNNTKLRNQVTGNVKEMRVVIRYWETNVASEEIMLSILQARKDAGDYSLPTSSSIATKRSL